MKLFRCNTSLKARADIYVAGPSLGYQHCAELRDLLITEGYNITHDWTQEFDEPANKIKGMLWPQHPAAQDYEGVVTCNALVARVMPFVSTTGMWFEMGLALGLGKPVIAWLDYSNLLSVNKGECVEYNNYLLRVQDWFSKQAFLHAPGVSVELTQEDVLATLEARLLLNG